MRKNPPAHLILIVAFLALCGPVRGQVIAEIHYHPVPGQEMLEFVEIANDSSTPVDLSGYAFAEGISYIFPDATILRSNARLVVCADVDAIRARYGVENAVGNYTGRLDNGGERLTLVNHVGIVISSVRYRDDGQWPVGADGTGHTLTLQNVHLDASESESWAQSFFPGGTPGVAESEPENEETGQSVAARGLLVFNELVRGSRSGEGWVELYNRHAEAIDVTGFRLTADPAGIGHEFSVGTTLPPKGFLVVTETATSLALSEATVQLFLLDPTGTVVTASVFDRVPPPPLEMGVYSECLFPDGGRAGWVTDTPTPGAANHVAVVQDLVINEIHYHPPEDRGGEFIELHNRGSEAIDLSDFRFTKGIRGTIPQGSVLAAGGYLVLAQEPKLLEEHYSFTEALGPFPYDGTLSNSGENVRLVDRSGNLVDEVRYFDGGRWSLWADGKGASLELIDPRQDNDIASAWSASDETDKTAWERLAFVASDFVPHDETELHIRLVERGICHVDDVSVTPGDGGANFIPNPGFEEASGEWRFGGNHVRSSRITSDVHSGSASLEIVATAKGDSRMCNQIEVDTKPRLTAGTYEVSLWARWVRGTSLIILHGEYTSGPWGGLSGNILTSGFRMTVPWNLGTPGKENSVRRRLREETGSANLGPAIGDVRHHPPLPAPDEPVTVRARVDDADGVASVEVLFRQGDAGGEFTSLALADDGADEDVHPGDGIYSGTIPGLARRTKIVFFIEATDNRGAARRFPVDAPAHTLLYMVEEPVPSTSDVYRIILDDARTEELRYRPIQSSELLDGTFVFNAERAFYGIGVRNRGAGSRPRNFRVSFPKDDRFDRERRTLNLDRKSFSPIVEGVAYFLVERNGTPRTPTPSGKYGYAGTLYNGRAVGRLAAIQTVDRDYIKKWFGADAADGAVVLKAVGRARTNDVCRHIASEGASLTHRGDSPENYREYWYHSIHQTRNRWQPFIELTRLNDREQFSDAEFHREIGSMLDIEEFFRVVIARNMVGDFDTIFVSGGHNGYIAYNPRDERWRLLPYDIDKAFERHPNGMFPGDGFSNRLLANPAIRRLYLRILGDFVDDDGYYSQARLEPFLIALQEDTGLSTSGIPRFVAEVGAKAKEFVRPVTTIPFRIASGDGGDLETDDSPLTIEGDASVQVEVLFSSRRGGDLMPIEPEWLSPTRWRSDFEVPPGTSRLDVIGLNGDGEVVGATGVTVHRFSGPGPVFLRGDVDGDLRLSVTDVVRTLTFLFGRTSIACLDAADFDDSGAVNLSDALMELKYIFSRGAPPPFPFPRVGRDPSEDLLECGL